MLFNFAHLTGLKDRNDSLNSRRSSGTREKKQGACLHRCLYAIGRQREGGNLVRSLLTSFVNCRGISLDYYSWKFSKFRLAEERREREGGKRGKYTDRFETEVSWELCDFAQHA